VSRKVSADMFGLGLRTYRRKIQRMSESVTVRGRSLWEVVLEHAREHGLVTRLELLTRFSNDDEAQIRAVLHDAADPSLAKIRTAAVPKRSAHRVGRAASRRDCLLAPASRREAKEDR
jgi:hypothetical protein